MKEAIELIQSEMKPSLGCTEPVAIGLAVSKACNFLKNKPEHIYVTLSSNIFKNAFCVKIPNVGFSGVALAAALGCVLSKPDDDMDIFGRITAEAVAEAGKMVEEEKVKLEILEEEKRFYIGVCAENEKEKIETITVNSHDNMAKVVYNGQELFNHITTSDSINAENAFDITSLTVAEVFAICEKIDLSEIRFLNEAVEMNLKVSQMGTTGDFGLNVGKTITQIETEGGMKEDVVSYVRKIVASACDCRMGGGNIAAMTVLGSGNQGIEAILPVAAVCKYLNLSEEKLLRSVMISIMTTIYMKYNVGRLSPVCGAALSGAAASSAIAWLLGGTYEQMEGAIKNMLGNLAGMVCDGAKDGCALKLSNCAGEAVVSAQLALHQCMIKGTDGIISNSLEDTVKNMAELSSMGMVAMDNTLIKIMLNKKD